MVRLSIRRNDNYAQLKDLKHKELLWEYAYTENGIPPLWTAKAKVTM